MRFFQCDRGATYDTVPISFLRFILLVALLHAVDAASVVRVCTGGACMNSGASALMQAAALMASSEESVTVKERTCCLFVPQRQHCGGC